MASVSSSVIQLTSRGTQTHPEFSRKPVRSGLHAVRRVRAASMPAPAVFVIDDDGSLSTSVERLVASARCEARTFASAWELFLGPAVSAPVSIIVDLASANANALLRLQQRLARERPEIAVVFVASVGDGPTMVQAIKAGAFDFLVRPVSDDVLARTIDSALESSRTALERRRHVNELHRRYETLTHREREVMALVVAGRLNKQVGAELGISEITVKAHRGRVMHKMQARSLPELVTDASALGVGRRELEVRIEECLL